MGDATCINIWSSKERGKFSDLTIRLLIPLLHLPSQPNKRVSPTSDGRNIPDFCE